jgi:hypothetical protein
MHAPPDAVVALRRSFERILRHDSLATFLARAVTAIADAFTPVGALVLIERQWWAEETNTYRHERISADQMVPSPYSRCRSPFSLRWLKDHRFFDANDLSVSQTGANTMAGLDEKYEIRRTKDTELIHDGFVLRVRSDPAAWMAAWYYASMTYNMDLARDMREWLLNNMPTEETVGSEGETNSHLLEKVADMANAPNALPTE